MAEAETIVQVKVWLDGVSPTNWRRVRVPGGITLRELHGVIQVTMGWEGLHLYRFLLRAGQYGSSELGGVVGFTQCSSPA
jgi:Plasmid pRiA4b ORF-3-like protein